MGIRTNRIINIVRLTQMVKRWRKHAASSSSRVRSVPSDVPPGHVAVIVGSSARRYVVRVAHLNHPAFRHILETAADEVGFDNNDGPLYLPCDESSFEATLMSVSVSVSVSVCRASSEARPLLRSVPYKPLC